jgi:hypothetical protein
LGECRTVGHRYPYRDEKRGTPEGLQKAYEDKKKKQAAKAAKAAAAKAEKARKKAQKKAKAA